MYQKKNNMKIGILTITHQSDELRPNGFELVTKFVNSLSNIEYEYECVIIDNSSPNDIIIGNTKVIKIEDQTKYGYTGAMEIGSKYLIENGADLVILNNDDLFYNKTINNFIQNIINHPYKDISVFGPVSNGILGGVQHHNQPTNQIIELTGNINNMVNGFMFAFTKEFYAKFQKSNGDLFNKEEFPWGGSEEEFQKRIWDLGGRSFVIGHCWVDHTKIRGWHVFAKKI